MKHGIVAVNEDARLLVPTVGVEGVTDLWYFGVNLKAGQPGDVAVIHGPL